MVDLTLETFALENLSPVELEQKRRDLIAKMQREYKGFEDPDIPTDLLQQLAIITSSLRRKNAGPPKTDKKKVPASRATTDDLMA